MAPPSAPVTLSAQQVQDLANGLSALRHSVNNQLALIVAAAELIKVNPDIVPRMVVTLLEQPPKITGELKRFSDILEEALGGARDAP